MIEPLPYQTEGHSTIDRFGGRCLMAWDMGTGKTLTSLWWLEKNEQDRLPAVVICPASVKYQWEHEAVSILGWRPSIVEGQSPPKQAPRYTKLTIINYDVLRFWVEWLRKLKPKTIIIDESHYCANPSAKRTKAVKSLAKGIPNILALSGTPLVNRPIELFPMLNLLRPDAFQSRWSYGQEYCGAKLTPWGWDFKGATKKDGLHKLLSSTCMSRLKKSDVLKDLPPKLRQVVPVKMKDDGAEYKKAENDLIEWLRKQDPEAARRAKKALALTKLGHLLRLAARLKLRAIVDWINDFQQESGEKLVVFAQHRKMIEALSRRCSCKSVVVDGQVTGRSRHATIKQFQQDKSVRLLIGNMQAAGIGITLTAASNVAFAELGWRPGDHTQAEDRCHRLGQKGTVWAYYLVARGTIEEKLCEVIQKKQQTVSAILDGGKTDGDLDVFDQLLNIMRVNKLL